MVSRSEGDFIAVRAGASRAAGVSPPGGDPNCVPAANVALHGCVCLGTLFGFAPPVLAGVLGCVCWCSRSASTLPILAGIVDACASVCLLCLYLAFPGSGVRRGCV